MTATPRLMNGPALPTSAQLRTWPWQFHYRGPWINNSGLRVSSDYVPTVPNVADLRYSA